MLNTTLPFHIENLKNNFTLLTNNYPKLYLAAEQVTDLFDQLFTERIKINNGELWEYTSARMLFGAYSSWVYSFLMTASALNDIGLMILRRSIEFVCYISKIKNNDERAKLWINKSDNVKNRKQFSNMFSIPNKYLSEKYRHLVPLLVWFDYASDFGTHANFATLVTKWKEENVNKFTMSFQDPSERIPLSSFSSVKVGSILIEILIKDLNNNLKNVDELHERTNTMKKIVKEAAIEVSESEYDGNVPFNILQAINSDDKQILEKQFNDLKQRYQIH